MGFKVGGLNSISNLYSDKLFTSSIEDRYFGPGLVTLHNPFLSAPYLSIINMDGFKTRSLGKQTDGIKFHNIVGFLNGNDYFYNLYTSLLFPIPMLDYNEWSNWRLQVAISVASFGNNLIQSLKIYLYFREILA